MMLEQQSTKMDQELRHRNARWSSGAGQAMEGLSIRPFRGTDNDYKRMAAIAKANTPDSTYSPAELRHNDETWKEGYLRKRVIAEMDGRAIGYATYGQAWWSDLKDNYYFHMAVDPKWQNTEVLDALYTAVVRALSSHRPRRLTSEFRENLQYLVDFVEARGYSAKMRFPISELDVQQFDARRFGKTCRKVREAGIRIENLVTIAAEDADWKRKMWDLEWEIEQDIPSPIPLKRMPFDYWQKRVLDSPYFLADAQFIARDGDEFVGITALWLSDADPKKLFTGLTGVVRSHRRRGIATALKVRGITSAKQRGIQLIETDNEENNPMLDLNKQLGFYEKPALVYYEKNSELEERGLSKEILS